MRHGQRNIPRRDIFDGKLQVRGRLRNGTPKVRNIIGLTIVGENEIGTMTINDFLKKAVKEGGRGT